MMSKVILDNGVDPELEESYKVFNIEHEDDKGIDAHELKDMLSKFDYDITL